MVEPDRQSSGLAVANFFGHVEDRHVIFIEFRVDTPTRAAIAIHGCADVTILLAEIRRLGGKATIDVTERYPVTCGPQDGKKSTGQVTTI